MNKSGPSVRQRLPRVPVSDTDDRRVRRTRQALAHALIDLVLAKRYDAITIQDLLDRADIGRSTFYSHYRGKDDLLLRSFERMLETLDQALERDVPPNRRVAPARELFAHVGEMRVFHQALARARVLDRQYQVGIVHMSRTIEHRLAARPARSGAAAMPLPVQARALAGALFAMLRWWVDHDAPYTPQQMDDMFHALRPDTL